MTADRSLQERSGQPPWMMFVTMIVLAAVVVGVVLIYSRLESLEDRLAYQPPTVRAPSGAGTTTELSSNAHAVYVPGYSHVYSLGGTPVLLATTLSVHNTDPAQALVIASVRYFDTNGAVIRSFLDAPLEVGPLATAEFLVEARDTSGGSGANFIVEWSGEEDLSPPIIEAVMIGMDGTHGLSFVRSGQEIDPS